MVIGGEMSCGHFGTSAEVSQEEVTTSCHFCRH